MAVREINIQTGQEIVRDYTPEEFAAIQQSNSIAYVPPSVSMRQARLALLNDGKLQAVINAISEMEGPSGDAARIEWEYSNEVRRNQPLTIALAQVLGLTSEEMDQLFLTAVTL